MKNLNQKDKTELIFTAGLIVVFVVLLVAFLGRTKKGPGPSKSFLPKIFFSSPKFTYDAQRNKGTPFILDKAAGEIIDIKRDPFTFGLNQGAELDLGANLSLKGILWDEGNPSVVINESVLKTGDMVSGYTVKQILKDSVILQNGQSTLELKLNP